MDCTSPLRACTKIADALKYELNTKVEDTDLSRCLVAALGKTGLGSCAAPSLLILDEVNLANEDNKAFIEGMFLSIARDRGMICVILTNKEETAETFIAINRGKIQPFPGAADSEENWEFGGNPKWRKTVFWTRDELMALIRYDKTVELRERLDSVFTEQFPVDGQTPGEVLRVADLKIAQGKV
jgi:hypothetical protein